MSNKHSKRSVSERFSGKVAPDAATGCWLWKDSLDKDGYGKLWVDGRNVRAHRVAWMLAHGDPPQDALILHRCDRPACVRVDHLYAGTPADNMKDKAARGRCQNQWRGFCKQGHEMAGANRHVTPKGNLYCCRCNSDRSAARRARMKRPANGGPATIEAIAAAK